MNNLPIHPLAVAVLVALGGVLSFVLYFAGNFVSPLLRYDPEDPGFNKGYWSQEISSAGAERAYEAFVEKNNLIPEARRHLFAHAMGEALFAELGIEAVATCTDAYSFGCYHGLFSRAIAEGGKDAVLQLDAACTERFGNLSGCSHGLGHGILEYVGYENLDKALSMCSSLVSQPAPLLGCTSGVFMEYLAPLKGSDGSLAPSSRPFDPELPFAPCTDVSEEYRSSCYFELGQWFRQTPGTDYGALCGRLEESAKRNCFLGIGTDMTRGWKDADTLIAKCARYDAENELACRAGAAWSLVGSPTAVALCAYGNAELTQECIEMADLTEGGDASIRRSLQ